MEHLLAQTCERVQTILTALYSDQVEESQLYEFKIILAKLNNRCQSTRMKLMSEREALQNLLISIEELEQSFAINAANNKRTATPKQVSFALSSDSASATPNSPLSLSQQAILTKSNNSPSVTGIFFDIIDSEDYNQIPKYIKGRLTLDKINATIESLNRLYVEKYNLMRQHPSKLTAEQRQRYYDWKEMECEEVGGLYFITESDVKNNNFKGGNNIMFKLDPTGRAVLSMLRHLGKLKEIRSAGIVRLAVLH